MCIFFCGALTGLHSFWCFNVTQNTYEEKNLQSQNLRKKFYQKKKKGGKKKNQKKVAFTYSLRTLAEILYSTSLE